MTELEMLGYSFSESYKRQLKESQQQKAEERRQRKEKRHEHPFDHDEYFAMIVD